MATKHCYKGYINNGEVGLGGKTKLLFRKQGRYEVGDAVLWDAARNMFRVLPKDYIEFVVDKERYIPTGVIAIPSSHDVYGTEEAGVLGLVGASMITPDTGTTDSEERITFGTSGAFYYIDNSIRGQVPYVGSNGTVQKDIIGLSDKAVLPSDAFVDTQGATENIYDPETKYYNYPYADKYAPSPYTDDGGRNPTYYQTEAPSYSNNALDYFNGKASTQTLCNEAVSQPNWKTDATLQFSDGAYSSYYPVACACWRYHTAGTSQGDWYCPSLGELGYVCARHNKLNSTIYILKTHFNIAALSLKYDGVYWTSTGFERSTQFRFIDFETGETDSTLNSQNLRARMFTRLR